MSAETTCFHAPIRVVGYQRSGGNGKRRFTPKPTRECMAALREAALASKPRPVPSTHYASVLIVLEYAGGVRPDVDNAEKTILDALKGIAWIDDKQVTDKTTTLYEHAGVDSVGVSVFKGDPKVLPICKRPPQMPDTIGYLREEMQKPMRAR